MRKESPFRGGEEVEWGAVEVVPNPCDGRIVLRRVGEGWPPFGLTARRLAAVHRVVEAAGLPYLPRLLELHRPEGRLVLEGLERFPAGEPPGKPGLGHRIVGAVAALDGLGILPDRLGVDSLGLRGEVPVLRDVGLYPADPSVLTAAEEEEGITGHGPWEWLTLPGVPSVRIQAGRRLALVHALGRLLRELSRRSGRPLPPDLAGLVREATRPDPTARPSLHGLVEAHHPGRVPGRWNAARWNGDADLVCRCCGAVTPAPARRCASCGAEGRMAVLWLSSRNGLTPGPGATRAGARMAAGGWALELPVERELAVLTVGRSPAADLHLAGDATVSRLHGRLCLDPGGLAYADGVPGGTSLRLPRNPARLHGIPVGGEPAPLPNGALLRIGSLLVAVDLQFRRGG